MEPPRADESAKAKLQFALRHFSFNHLRWRSHLPPREPPKQRDESGTGHADYPHLELAQLGQPKPLPDFHKPLPPVPREKVATGAEQIETSVQSATKARFSSSPPPLPATDSRFRRMSGTFKPRRERSTLEETPGKSAVQPIARVSTTGMYADKGTQTSPSLLAQDKHQPVKSAWKLGSRHSLGPLDEETSPQRKEHRTPLWSPRKFLSSNGHGDYFSLPTRTGSRMDNKLAQESDESSTETQKSILKHEVPVVSEASLTRPPPILAETEDSVGTHVSQFSENVPGKGNALERTLVTRKAVSESTASDIQKLGPDSAKFGTSLDVYAIAAELQRSSDPSLPQRSKDASGVRPMPYPFQAMPSFASQSRNVKPKTSHSSRSSNVSPLFPDIPYSRSSSSNKSSSLRREYTNPKAEPSEQSSDSGESKFYRDPIQTSNPEGTSATTLNLPDHLRSSPLCPRHPKHRSGGKGYCPIHGQDRTSSETSAELRSPLKEELRVSKLVPPSPAESHQGSDADIPVVDIGVADHQADDPNCPANMRVRGICLYHGRAMKMNSEDSVTRFGII